MNELPPALCPGKTGAFWQGCSEHQQLSNVLGCDKIYSLFWLLQQKSFFLLFLVNLCSPHFSMVSQYFRLCPACLGPAYSSCAPEMSLFLHPTMLCYFLRGQGLSLQEGSFWPRAKGARRLLLYSALKKTWHALTYGSHEEQQKPSQ